MTTLRTGALAILPSVFAMALTDAIIKGWSDGISLWQIWVLRSVLVLPVLYILARGRVRVDQPGWVALRCLALVSMYLTMYPALPLIDMSLAGAAFYTAPFFIAGLSALVLGQRIGWLQWLAILVGFAGLLIIVRPFGMHFSPAVLLPVAAAFCYACAAVVTRARCTRIDPVALGFWLNLAFLGVGAAAALAVESGALRHPGGMPLLFAAWQPTAADDWLMIAGLAVLMLGVSIGVAVAYKAPQPAVIATLEYCYIIFASFWGIVLFGERLDGQALFGIALIAAGGIAVLLAPPAGAAGGERQRSLTSRSAS